MDVEASIEQVTGILVREGLKYHMSADGQTHRLLFGSAAVFIDFNDWQDDSVVITVHSPVLQDIHPESAGAADRLDDELAEVLGGKPYEVKAEEWSGGEEPR